MNFAWEAGFFYVFRQPEAIVLECIKIVRKLTKFFSSDLKFNSLFADKRLVISMCSTYNVYV